MDRREFIEAGGGYRGLRLHLTMHHEEKNQTLIEALRKKQDEEIAKKLAEEAAGGPPFKLALEEVIGLWRFKQDTAPRYHARDVAHASCAAVSYRAGAGAGICRGGLSLFAVGDAAGATLRRKWSYGVPCCVCIKKPPAFGRRSCLPGGAGRGE